MVTRWVLLLPLIGLLSACATVPTGPTPRTSSGKAPQWRPARR